MNVLTKQQRIAELAKQQPEVSFTSLNHYLDVDWLREAYRRLRQASAPGYDGQTVADYGKDLETNLNPYWTGLNLGRTLHRQCDTYIFRKGRGKQHVQLEVRRRKTRCCSVQERCAWNRSLRRILWTAHTGSDRVGRPMGRSAPCGMRGRGAGSRGEWIGIYPSFSIPWIMRIFGRCSSIGCVMV